MFCIFYFKTTDHCRPGNLCTHNLFLTPPKSFHAHRITFRSLATNALLPARACMGKSVTFLLRQVCQNMTREHVTILKQNHPRARRNTLTQRQKTKQKKRSRARGSPLPFFFLWQPNQVIIHL